MKNFVKIIEKVENFVNDCEGYVEYGFYPDENVVSVRVFEYDENAEYSEDFDEYDFNLITADLFDKIKSECKEFVENVETYTPNKFDKMGYGYFNYLEILITPLNEVI